MGEPVYLKSSDKPITAVRFNYDKFGGTQFEIRTYTTGIDSDGGDIEMYKRMGPNNYTGHRKEGTIRMNAEQVKRLFEILDDYDLEAWTHLPRGGAGYSPTRSLMVFSGEEIVYDIMWNAPFPKTIPPREDIMYCDLFNLFNGIIDETDGWEEVRGATVPDPREEPAYKERTITWFGKERRLVLGTGVGYADGQYADIDYGDLHWWEEEGFVGRWVLDRYHPEDELPSYNSLTHMGSEIPQPRMSPDMMRMGFVGGGMPGGMGMGMPGLAAQTGMGMPGGMGIAAQAAGNSPAEIQGGTAAAPTPTEEPVKEPFAELIVNTDGTLRLTLGESIWTGHVDPKRSVINYVYLYINRESDGAGRRCDCTLLREQSYERIVVSARPGPVPTTQFSAIHVCLKKVE